MEIPAASIAQVTRARDGRIVEIEPAVSEVAKQIHEINPELKLRFSEAGECWIVYQERRRSVDGKLLSKHVVTTWDANEGPVDSGLVERVRRISAPDYDAAAEMEKIEAEYRRDRERRDADRLGELATRVHHGLRKDLGAKGRIFVPGRP